MPSLVSATAHVSHHLAAVGEPANPWFSWSFVRDNSDAIQTAVREHVMLTVVTMLVSIVIAVPLALVAYRFGWLAGTIVGVTGGLYTIPSLSLFAVLAAFTGLRARAVVIGLVIYALLILVRNTLAGLQNVPADVREAATGMGYGRRRVLWGVDLPLALPAIIAGVRVATVSTIALVTVGVIVGAGGLGTLILAGFNNNFYRAEIVTASLLTIA